MSAVEVSVGDWIAVMRSGQVVIGEVSYILGRKAYVAGIGELDLNWTAILEVRTPAPEPSP